jgi:hypothetical protein
MVNDSAQLEGARLPAFRPSGHVAIKWPLRDVGNNGHSRWEIDLLFDLVFVEVPNPKIK